jgi:ubiquitin-activating enzyme E1
VRDLGGHAGQEISIDLIQPFQVSFIHRHTCFGVEVPQAVVLCGASYEKQLEINDWTHQNGVHFISADTRGLFGCVTAAFLLDQSRY